MGERTRLVHADERRHETTQTPGMTRDEAVRTPTMWAGTATTTGHTFSGWHHHGEYESVIYVLSGALRMEFGPNGEHSLDAAPGDFINVPKWAVHRESNPSDEPADIIVVRAGQGESTYNVAGPASVAPRH